MALPQFPLLRVSSSLGDCRNLDCPTPWHREGGCARAVCGIWFQDGARVTIRGWLLGGADRGGCSVHLPQHLTHCCSPLVPTVASQSSQCSRPLLTSVGAGEPLRLAAMQRKVQPLHTTLSLAQHPWHGLPSLLPDISLAVPHLSDLVFGPAQLLVINTTRGVVSLRGRMDAHFLEKQGLNGRNLKSDRAGSESWQRPLEWMWFHALSLSCLV